MASGEVGLGVLGRNGMMSGQQVPAGPHHDAATFLDRPGPDKRFRVRVTDTQLSIHRVGDVFKLLKGRPLIVLIDSMVSS